MSEPSASVPQLQKSRFMVAINHGTCALPGRLHTDPVDLDVVRVVVSTVLVVGHQHVGVLPDQDGGRGRPPPRPRRRPRSCPPASLVASQAMPESW